MQIDLEGSDRAPTAAQREVVRHNRARLDRALRLWKGVKTGAGLGYPGVPK